MLPTCVAFCLQGTKLYIDGVLVLDNDGPKNILFEATTPPLTLTRGWHPLRLEFAQGPSHYNGAPARRGHALEPQHALFPVAEWGLPVATATQLGRRLGVCGACKQAVSPGA